MNNRDTLFPIIKDDITFDTLLTQAKTVIEQQSGQYWNDTGENDPGITLLEACCYGASDLAYRHSLPLKDLLTPEQNQQTSGDGIFPKEFGPQETLTCGPITAEDYRRALLDLHSNDKNDSYFFFDDAQLIREPEDQRYTYWYDKQKCQYSFINDQDSIKLTLRGNYWLYLLPGRETQANKTLAQTKLKTFLEDNSNLGESVSKIIWLKPTDISLKIDIQLNDDVKDIADIFAKIYTTAEQMVLEKPRRYTTQAMKEMGYSNEEIFNGPYLRHGWIPKLPSIKDYTKSRELNLIPLVNQLLGIKGIKSVTRFTLDNKEKNDNWSCEIKEDHYPRLWGNDPLQSITSQSITSPNSPLTITAKGGIKVTTSKQDIEKKIIPEQLNDTQPELLNWNKHRKVLNYHPVSNKLPSCYGLQTNTQQQIQLHQFMLTFEQILANSCADLALLPKLLAFKQRGDTVHGTQWPFEENSVDQNVHQNIKPNLITQANNEVKINNNDKNYARELVILDYLLQYFGAKCSIPLLKPNLQQSELKKFQDRDFLSTQREYLAQQPNLAYQRNNIRIDKVSALQKRIAARLGLGGECFKPEPNLANLPFYLIEHRQLLPIRPDKIFDERQKVSKLEVITNDPKNHYVKITRQDSAGQLLKDQMIDLIIDLNDRFEFSLSNQAITEVAGNTFSLNINNSNSLRDNLNKITEEHQKGSAISWKNSPIWMEDIYYPLIHSKNPPQDARENEYWITLNAKNYFPAMIKKDDEITLIPNSDMGPSNFMGVNYDNLSKAHIIKFDPAKKQILVKEKTKSKGDSILKEESPLKEKKTDYHWYFSGERHSQVDRFSFVVSVVLNQELIKRDAADLHKLESWVKNEILAELPAHISLVIHWLSHDDFNDFAKTYKLWQNSGTPLGDQAYKILEMLTLGKNPNKLARTIRKPE
ncbi:hypothetical protein [Photorhabdus luminescens]|uniref:hypothetical protein n=1 Tax=Photorhabdus luminescens TaxID=29488 RepID=UPI00223F0C93|nr:hypothetical protein [Photorhabdus luminescens]MCW7762594.1 hypothetical protein [Photorhabdus luminescens subsp. venezuelensis]